MTKLDPIIAVHDIEESTKWYQKVFGFRKAHGGNDFSVLVSLREEVILCLHKWEAHRHPSLSDAGVSAGNGLMLYFRTDHLEVIRQNAEKMGCIIEEEIHLNENSLKKEFSLRDPNGYFLTITEYHEYKGN